MLYLFLVSLVLCAGCVVGTIKTANMGSNAAFLYYVGTCVLAVSVFIFGGLLIGKHFDRVSCATYGQKTERATKFVTYNTFTWDCLTRTRDGRWIPKDNLREFGDSKP